jgi:proton-dependent oligopeptide transporter, POT family
MSNGSDARQGAADVMMTATDKPPGLQPVGTWFGHPRGLSTLFFTEMWERLSYYGMRGILILFMTAAASTGGLGFGDAKAAAVYGLYTAMVYLLALPGGWVADNLWGQRRAVFVGGCIIAAGHFMLAGPLVGLPELPTFYTGLVLIVVGTGLLKPNISTMVGDLYPEGGARRDAGFSIYYMGINIGAFLGPLICGYLGEQVNWHWGFSAAGFGMLFGLIQYKMGDRHLGSAGYLDSGVDAATLARRNRNFLIALGVTVVLVVAFVLLGTSGALGVTLQQVATWLGYGIVLLTIVFFTYLILGTVPALVVPALYGVLLAVLLPTRGVDQGAQVATAVILGLFILTNIILVAVKRERVGLEKRRLMVIFWIFLLAALFWSGFEQAGSSMNLFAERLTDRNVAGWEMPASWLQSINPIFIILLAPVFGWMWTWLAHRRANPSIPVKFALGLLGLAMGFFVLAWGAANASAENPVSPAWLIVTYFLHTAGELALSPVGLSSITKLAPRNRVGQMMGIWFIASALGNLFAGLVAGRLESLAPQALFWNVAMTIGGAGLLALLLAPFIRRLMGAID